MSVCQIENDTIDWLGVSGRIASRLKKTFTWLEWDDLVGTATLAVVKANDKYDQDKSYGDNRIAYLYMKGYYLSIDILRETKVIFRTPRAFIVFNETHLRFLMDSAYHASVISERLEQTGVPQECVSPKIHEDLLSGLTERKKAIVRLRCEDYTFVEIGKRLSLSDCCAFKLYKQAIEELKELRADLKEES